MAGIIVGLFILFIINILFPRLEEPEIDEEIIIYLEEWEKKPQYDDWDEK